MDSVEVMQETHLPPESLTTLLEAGGDGAALVCPDDQIVVSHQELVDSVNLLAGLLAGLGVERGHRLAIVLPNGPEIVELLLATVTLGATAAPLNPSYTEAEYRFYLEDIDPRLLLVAARAGSAVRAAREDQAIVDVALRETGLPRLYVHGTEAVAVQEFEPGSPNDTALLLHTSGTTSRPKLVPLLQRNLMASVKAIGSHYKLTEHDVSYCAMPLFHVHGLIASTLAQLASGGAVVIPRRMSSRLFWQQVREHHVSWVSASPTIHQMLVKHVSSPVPTLRFVRSCSSALSPALMDRLEHEYGAPVVEAYGMTEASHQMTSNPLPPEPRSPGSVGIPAGAEVRIVDAQGSELPSGQTGEVAIRGPGVTPGYLKNPEANAQSFVDGWFLTGDLGLLDGGYLRLQGRIKELIIRGGENISPAEVEEVLKTHPAVVDAACFGIEDEKYGQVVGAAVVLRAAVDELELRTHCRASLADLKVPRVIHVTDVIPRTPTGKVQRSRIVAVLAEPKV